MLLENVDEVAFAKSRPDPCKSVGRVVTPTLDLPTYFLDGEVPKQYIGGKSIDHPSQEVPYLGVSDLLGGLDVG